MKQHLHLAFTLALTACAAADPDPSDFSDDFGTVEQPVGVKFGTNDAYGSGVVGGAPHSHARCTTSGTPRDCSVPRTKGPTYYIDSSLNATEAQRARSSVGLIDSQTNWTFTETTDAASATLTFNRVDNFCFGEQIEGVVCVNLTGQGNVLTESPSSLFNRYTEHTKGVIHLDRTALNACTSCSAGEKSKRMMHGFQSAILVWMGDGIGAASISSPSRRSILNPDDTGGLTNSEKCRLNGFLPTTQFGGATTIGLTTTTACAD
jgi:hypothetical protein